MAYHLYCHDNWVLIPPLNQSSCMEEISCGQIMFLIDPAAGVSELEQKVLIVSIYIAAVKLKVNS